MPGRFGLGPLARGLGSGLRKRRDVGDEAPDVRTRTILLAAPLLVVALGVGLNWSITVPQDFLAGMALLIGAELAVFTQLASWRERLNQRARKTEGVSRRALDEAVAHVLTSTIASITAAALLIAISVLNPSDPMGTVETWATRVVSAAVLGLLAYLGLTLWIVVNLLWDAYIDANRSVE